MDVDGLMNFDTIWGSGLTPPSVSPCFVQSLQMSPSLSYASISLYLPLSLSFSVCLSVCLSLYGSRLYYS